MLQTILGSGGGIGIPLARELKIYTDQIRLVGRTPRKVNQTDHLFPADLSDPAQVDRAIEGSAVVYVTIGFEYRLKVWQDTWPTFLQQVIQACERHRAKLVFFDNVYMYAKEAVPHMTEESPLKPPSEKGKVRLQLHEMIMQAVQRKSLDALIARAADFYGPDNKNSVLSIMVADNLARGKRAQAFGNIDKIHTYTYTPDAARATAILGNTPDAFNQVWHLPTTKEKLTTRDWINLVAAEMKAEAKVQVVPVWMLRILGLFMPVMREFPEMLYQYDQDYVFDSSRFEERFGVAATSPYEAIKKTFGKIE